jgi:2-C-methyl-D-erythritol 4-phosphate cytidylyltransferase
MKATALIVAAGGSVRFGGPVPKQFVEIGGKPLLAWTIGRFEAAESISGIVLVVAEDRIDYVREKVVAAFRFAKVLDIVAGGATRQESVARGLEALPGSTGLVAIHDGARPIVHPRDIDKVVRAAEVDGAAFLARPVTDTLKRGRDGLVVSTLDRLGLYRAQTPQAFRYDLILQAHRAAAAEGRVVTDDVALIESGGTPVRIIESRNPNTKVTTTDDLAVVASLLIGK